jgi:tetratricopeptide (TPR) repeat protein
MIGRHDEATSIYRKALELDPRGADLRADLGQVFLFQGKLDSALEQMTLEKDEVMRCTGLALVHDAGGERGRADSALNTLIEKYGHLAAYQVAEVFAYRGNAERAFAWLDRAYRQRDTGMIIIKVDPVMKILWNDPRWTQVLQRMNLG